MLLLLNLKIIMEIIFIAIIVEKLRKFVLKKMFKYIVFVMYVNLATCQSCLNDSKCSDCNLYNVTTSIGSFSYYICDQCVKNMVINRQTGICECQNGYFSNTNRECQACSLTCATCLSSSKCTTCHAEYFRYLDGDQCLCQQGYESSKNQTSCRQKPNILLIVLSSIGSIICMVFGFIFCAFIRMRRGDLQIHAETKRRHPSGQGQIASYGNQYDPNSFQYTNTSNIYWNSKNIQYSPNQVCSICLQQNPMFVTQCSHYFHSKCIYSWLQTRGVCPNCNLRIESKQIRRWCQKCKKALMPVIMNVCIKKTNKKKKQIVQSKPILIQICDQCESQSKIGQSPSQEKTSQLQKSVCLQHQKQFNFVQQKRISKIN